MAQPRVSHLNFPVSQLAVVGSAAWPSTPILREAHGWEWLIVDPLLLPGVRCHFAFGPWPGNDISAVTMRALSVRPGEPVPLDPDVPVWCRLSRGDGVVPLDADDQGTFADLPVVILVGRGAAPSKRDRQFSPGDLVIPIYDAGVSLAAGAYGIPYAHNKQGLQWLSRDIPLHVLLHLYDGGPVPGTAAGADYPLELLCRATNHPQPAHADGDETKFRVVPFPGNVKTPTVVRLNLPSISRDDLTNGGWNLRVKNPAGAQEKSYGLHGGIYCGHVEESICYPPTLNQGFMKITMPNPQSGNPQQSLCFGSQPWTTNTRIRWRNNSAVLATMNWYSYFPECFGGPNYEILTAQTCAAGALESDTLATNCPFIMSQLSMAVAGVIGTTVLAQITQN